MHALHEFVYHVGVSKLINDVHIRAAMKRDLRLQYEGDHETVIIEEMGVGHGISRIDLVVVNGVLHGFELKSDRDTLSRLPEQARAYGTVFDRVTLVVGERHLSRAVDVVPEWWGIRVARREKENVKFRDLKLPLRNPAPDPFSVASLLWRAEALNFLQELGGVSGMHSWCRTRIYSEIVERIAFDVLRERVRRCLRERRDWRSDGRRLSCGD
jgi:hypothetical protein